MFSKEILRLIFLDTGVVWHESSANDTHGEFCFVGQWNSTYQSRAREWIESSQERIKHVANVVCRESSVVPEALCQWANSELVDLISEITGQCSRENQSLGELLAENGVLPMLGMPTRVRLLYMDLKDGNYPNSENTIDREMEMAITEFAPGSKRVKDKQVYECNGFTPKLMWTWKGWETDGEALDQKSRILWCPECLNFSVLALGEHCLLYTSPSPRDRG